MEDSYTNVSNIITQINNPLHTVTVRNKLRTICGCLHSTIFLRIPTHWSFTDQMKYTCNGTTSELVTEYISINITC